MHLPEIRKIVLVGAGKLATNFGLLVKSKSIEILQVFNRTPATGLELAQKLSASYISDLDSVSTDADLYCIALSDSSVASVSRKISVNKKPIVHFSGSLDIEVLKSSSENYGVLYPPQTFSGEYSSEAFSGVPFCIEANSEECTRVLREFVLTFSDFPLVVTKQQRQSIHLAAVFACNFTNYIYSVSEKLMKNAGLSMEVLMPLIKKTALNASHENIFSYQTGPAVREDLEIMAKHISMLKAMPEYRKIYHLLSSLIIQAKKNEKL